MQNLFQKTISKPIQFNGIGLHSGLNSTVKIIPANENYGIVFKRIDLKENNIIEANFKNVSSARLCTTLKNSFGVSVSTVEHLLAAFYITGIDNIIVEVNNSEMPIMDGSSKDFVNLIKKIIFPTFKPIQSKSLTACFFATSENHPKLLVWDC